MTSSLISYIPCTSPAPVVAQLDACPTGDQKIAGSTPTGSAAIFREDRSGNIFMVILSLPLIQNGQMSVPGERMCTIQVNHLED